MFGNALGQVVTTLLEKNREGGYCGDGYRDPALVDGSNIILAGLLGAGGALLFAPVGGFTAQMTPFARALGEMTTAWLGSVVDLAIATMRSSP